MAVKGEQECLDALKAIGATPKVHEHVAVTTVDAWTPEVEKLGLKCTMVKNMFLKGKKGELVLVVALAATKTDLKLVAKAANLAGGAPRFAPPEALLETLGVIQGAVTPLAVVNDAKKATIVCLDQALLKAASPLAVHPCRNDRTVLVTPDELSKYFAHLKVTPKVVDFSAVEDAPAPADKKADKAPKAPKPEKEKKVVAAGETRLGLEVAKEDDFPEWYSQIVTKSEMLEYYDVSGCYIMRPWSHDVWLHVRHFFTAEIRELGVEECMFPMFVSKGALEREKDHVEGFAPEVAWVTKAGESDLPEPIALRPTSETVMYPNYAKWIRSYRDLPLQLNQWCNVVRWEFSHPTPFIRNREFLWQEGHSAWMKKEEADKEVLTILDLYRRVYEELMAVPVVCGRKTEKEKFCGGLYTTSVEAYIPAVGRGCQAATSHQLGQNFGKMFNIEIEDPNEKGEKLIPWQTSWGLSTRSLGVMIMVHGDNKGLVLPPRVASIQVVIVPCGLPAKASDEEKQSLYDTAQNMAKQLKVRRCMRVKADLRDNYSPAWRYNYWELKGVPVRIELGPKEVASGKLVCCRRDTGEKVTIPMENHEVHLQKLLDDIHDSMFNKQKAIRDEKMKHITKWEEFVPALNDKCIIMSPWCGAEKCEDNVKKYSAEESKAVEDDRAPSMGAKTLTIPLEQPAGNVGDHKCINKTCKEAATTWVLFGRSY